MNSRNIKVLIDYEYHKNVILQGHRKRFFVCECHILGSQKKLRKENNKFDYFAICVDMDSGDDILL